MTCHQKDHKPVDQQGNPKTRALMDAMTTHNQRSSDLLNDVLTALNLAEDSHEFLSTEDFLHKVGQINNKIRKGENNKGRTSNRKFVC